MLTVSLEYLRRANLAIEAAHSSHFLFGMMIEAAASEGRTLTA